MARSGVFAILVACGLALAGCGTETGHSGAAVPVVGAETVGDAAAIAAHQPTDSQDAAVAIASADALGSRIRALADESAGDPRDDDEGRDAFARADGTCRDGSEFLLLGRNGDNARSSEIRDFFDPGCTRVARDAVDVFTPGAPGEEILERIVSIYAVDGFSPIAVRRESSRIANATFGPRGFPIAREGFSRTTSSTLWISNREQSTSASRVVMLPGLDDENEYCQDTAGYSTTGIPSLDATFGWEVRSRVSTEPATRTRDGSGAVTLSSTQGGNTFAGPIGSLFVVADRSEPTCPAPTSAYALSGGAPSAFTMPIRATFRRGTLAALTVTGAAFAGGYTLDAYTKTGTGNDFADVTVRGTLRNGRVHVATLTADRFGNGALGLTATGTQYRLVDWTVVR